MSAGRHQVGEAHGGPVAARLAGDEIHHALDDEHGLRLARAAVRRDRHAVRVDAVEGHLDVGDAVRARQHRGAEQRHHQAARRVGARVVDEAIAQRQEPALVVEADLDRVDLRALLGGRQHVLQAVLEPPHGPAEAQRQEAESARPRDRRSAWRRSRRRRPAPPRAPDAAAEPSRSQMNCRTWCGTCDDAHTVRSSVTALYSATSPRVSMGWPPARPMRSVRLATPRRRAQRRLDVAARQRHPAGEVVGDVVVDPRGSRRPSGPAPRAAAPSRRRPASRASSAA